jgi:hypothetical protein
MGSKVLAATVTKIEKAKYFSVSFDSAPDVTHVDQLTFILWCVKNAIPKGHFTVYSHSWT